MDWNFIRKLFPEKIQFWLKSQNVVGIDIGGSSIKVIQLRKEKERAVLETYGELATGPYANFAIGQVVRLPDTKLITVLKDLFKEAGVNAKKAIVAIPAKGCFVTIIKVPQSSSKEMDNIIRFEARKYIPVPPGEVEMDWWILPGTGSGSKDDPLAASRQGGRPQSEASEKKAQGMAEVLLVAIHKEIIQKYRSVLSGAGIKTQTFEIEIFSIVRSSLVRQTAPVMIIDLGAAITKMSVVDYGLLRLSHNLARGSQELTSAISKSLNISFERAEQMKRQIGLSLRPEHKELVSVMEPVLSFIFSEIKQIMQGYRSKYNESIARVVLTGGGASLQGIVDMAVKNLGVEVTLADPFSTIEYPPFLQEVLKGFGPSFSVAAGLALRGL